MKREIDELFPKMIEWRRYLHQYPELSYQEEKTAQYVAQFLRSWGLEVHTGIGGHGVTGRLIGKEPGPLIALRADMDALPISDGKENCAYRSKVPGVMHACGHDGHMTMLLATAYLLSQKRDQLKGSILFLFQPAEEKPPGGAEAMIREGVLDSVDVIYGIHLWTPLPVGTIGVREAEMMAAADSFDIEIKGRGGHGGVPHQAIDAVAIASHTVVNLQTIVSRQIDPLQSAVITVGSIQGGQAFNVIADRCRLEGTVRTFSPEVRQQIEKQIEEVTSATCQMFGADYRLTYEYGYPTLVNHPSEARRIARVGREMICEEGVITIPPMMPSEDFAYYLQKKPGAFCFVGAGNKSEDLVHPHHHPLFDFDESALKIGVELFIRLVFDYLEHPSADPR
jgi:amidohydrolase